MTVKMDKFGGIMPRTHPTLLPDGMAIRAHNVKLKSGKLVPLREPRKAQGSAMTILRGGAESVSEAKSLHVWRRTDGTFDFLAFKGVTWMAPGNIADDERTRVIISGDTGDWVSAQDEEDGLGGTPVVYMRDPENPDTLLSVVRLWKDKLPALTATPSAAPSETDVVRYTAFFWTWVDGYGYESPASDASNEIEYVDGDTVTFTATADTEVELKPPSAVAYRLYKVVTGSETGNIQFVKEFTAGQVRVQLRESPATGYEMDFWDAEATPPSVIGVAVKDEDAGEVMPEIEAPPRDLTCIREVPGAFYCGFSPSAPKTVCFSDINLIYSWPVAYRYDVADNLVALAVTSNSVFALTDGWPYVLSGTAPEGMTVAKLAGPASCVSPRSVCVYKNAVYYASPQGLMTIYNNADSGTVCANLTDKIFTKDQWLALNPESCICCQFDGALHLFFCAGEDGETYGADVLDGIAEGERCVGLRIDLADGAAAVTTHDETAACACVDDAEDKLYYVRRA